MASRFVFYYWPLPFRGNFVRNIFAYTGTAYEEAPTEKMLEMKNSRVADQPGPFMAPPMLHDTQDDVFISQMPAICFYLSHQMGLMPSGLAEQAMAMKVIGDCTDVIEEITRSTGAQMWDKEAWGEFSTVRFVRWLSIFEELGTKNKLSDKDGFILGTEEATVADLAVHALFATMERCLPQLSPILRKNAPNVMALVDRLSANDGLKALVDKQKEALGNTYCGGMIEKSIRSMVE
eukprot:CAMPEP_0198152724 /NCGR_PEP_ID=MMETSP1443-20131203/61039_1 /TAXON_ID=186043 /ORGANISM="Entomoneis sp., Strain CCMP2396" /LENGTH=234 /DNA_ID=CAMNT_0043818835 /DNA_START=39 /DNA_END=743 /DNA_ORIENTATION=-